MGLFKKDSTIEKVGELHWKANLTANPDVSPTTGNVTMMAAPAAIQSIKL